MTGGRLCQRCRGNREKRGHQSDGGKRAYPFVWTNCSGALRAHLSNIAFAQENAPLKSPPSRSGRLNLPKSRYVDALKLLEYESPLIEDFGKVGREASLKRLSSSRKRERTRLRNI
jgi:hypothetical protein